MTLEEAQMEFTHRLDVFKREMERRGRGFQWGERFRTMARQGQLYAQGRTTPGPIVTKAKPGQSAHNFRLGQDIIPMLDGHRCLGAKLQRVGYWNDVREASRLAELTWGGNWRMRDYLHLELPDWKLDSAVRPTRPR